MKDKTEVQIHNANLLLAGKWIQVLDPLLALPCRIHMALMGAAVSVTTRSMFEFHLTYQCISQVLIKYSGLRIKLLAKCPSLFANLTLKSLQDLKRVVVICLDSLFLIN